MRPGSKYMSAAMLLSTVTAKLSPTITPAPLLPRDAGVLSPGASALLFLDHIPSTGSIKVLGVTDSTTEYEVMEVIGTTSQKFAYTYVPNKTWMMAYSGAYMGDNDGSPTATPLGEVSERVGCPEPQVEGRLCTISLRISLSSKATVAEDIRTVSDYEMEGFTYTVPSQGAVYFTDADDFSSDIEAITSRHMGSDGQYIKPSAHIPSTTGTSSKGSKKAASTTASSSSNNSTASTNSTAKPTATPKSEGWTETNMNSALLIAGMALIMIL